MGIYLTKLNMNENIPFKIFKDTHPNIQSLHGHEYMQIGYVTSGKIINHMGGSKFEYKKGGLYIVPPFIEHAVEKLTPDSEIMVCEFAESFINRELTESNRKEIFDFAYLEPFFISEKLIQEAFSLSIEGSLKIGELMDETYAYFNEKDQFYSLFCKANVLKIMAILCKEYATQKTNEKEELIYKYYEGINAAINYIKDNYLEKLYLEDVCKIALMSSSTFSYIFKQVLGKTFSEYLIELRLNRAKELLRESKHSITEVGINSGFSDAAYFSKIFKKTFGVTPNDFRRNSTN